MKPWSTWIKLTTNSTWTEITSNFKSSPRRCPETRTYFQQNAYGFVRLGVPAANPPPFLSLKHIFSLSLSLSVSKNRVKQSLSREEEEEEEEEEHLWLPFCNGEVKVQQQQEGLGLVHLSPISDNQLFVIIFSAVSPSLA